MNSELTTRIIFVIGVSGSGKSSVGRLLAEDLAMPFVDADDHHPTENIEKMSRGIPLEDEDRRPWIERLNQIAKVHLDSGCIIACSALKETYRDLLSSSIESKVRWVYLKGTYDQIFERMKQRQDHFMEAHMLKSQFDTLEEPENALTVDITDTPKEMVAHIVSILCDKG